MISHKSIAGTFRLATLGLGLAVAFSPSAMAGGHHQKGQLIAVPATSVVSQPAQMSYVQPAQMSYVQPAQMSYVQPAQMSYVQPAQMSYVQAVAAPPVQMGYAQPQAAPPPASRSDGSHHRLRGSCSAHAVPGGTPDGPVHTTSRLPSTTSRLPSTASLIPSTASLVPSTATTPGGLCPAAGGVSGGQRREFPGAIPVQLYQVPKQLGLFNHFQKQKVLIAR